MTVTATATSSYAAGLKPLCHHSYCRMCILGSMRPVSKITHLTKKDSQPTLDNPGSDTPGVNCACNNRELSPVGFIGHCPINPGVEAGANGVAQDVVHLVELRDDGKQCGAFGCRQVRQSIVPMQCCRPCYLELIPLMQRQISVSVFHSLIDLIKSPKCQTN